MSGPDVLVAQRIAVCRRFETAWHLGIKLPFAQYLGEVPESERTALLAQLLSLELDLRRARGERPREEEYRLALPSHADLIARVFRMDPYDLPETSGFRSPEGGPGGMTSTCQLPQRIGKYPILEELGTGGMGIVYKAWSVERDQYVAIKVVRHGRSASRAEILRFQREAELLSRLHHPNLVRIYEVGQHDNLPFLCLEYIAGQTLEEYLHGIPQPPGISARFLAILARAIHIAHQAGIIHRDLKPGNILLACPRSSPGTCKAGEPRALTDFVPKITDFGLACRVDVPGASESNVVMGTPSYMAPEQVGRERGVGMPTDLHALGAILYELLTGRPPFRAETPAETLVQVSFLEPIPPSRLRPEVPRDLERICLKCLEKEPAQRYTSAADLAADLERCRSLGGGSRK